MRRSQEQGNQGTRMRRRERRSFEGEDLSLQRRLIQAGRCSDGVET